MQVEWEIIANCNYDCGYCGCLSPVSIGYEKREDVLLKFIDELHEKYSDVELFLLGGEVYIHPKIEMILSKLIDIEQNFVVQTNYSEVSILKMSQQDLQYKINISIHPDDAVLEDMVERIKLLPELNMNVRRIDVMYVGKHSLEWHKQIKAVLDPKYHDILRVMPVADFRTEGYQEHLKEYNNLVRSPIYNELYNFDDCMSTMPGYEDEQRCFTWERQINTYGKECLYKDNYIIYNPQLYPNTCCYKKDIALDNNICKEPVCFLM